MLRPAAALLLATVVVTATTACEPFGSAKLYALGTGDEYVALGDSYTAAPGTGPLDGNDGCIRSRTNYPHQIAEATGMTLTDVSCSAATSAALIEPFETSTKKTVPPQLDALSASTDLVTMGIGANDFNLIGTIFLTCPGLALEPDAGDSPCTDADQADGGSKVNGFLEELEANLDDRLAEIERRAPDAEVIVIGYPQIVPEEGTCAHLPVAPGDYPFVRRINEGINDAVRAAAERAGVDFLDLVPGTEDHHLCAEEAWVAGTQPTRAGATPWHPYPEEQEFVRDLVLTKL